MFSLRSLPILFLTLALSGQALWGQAEKEEVPPIKALLVTGGCCHDYETQKAILSVGIRERVSPKIEWTIIYQGEGKSDEKIPLFDDPDWAADYDIVVHNYCFTRVQDPEYVDRILAPHRAGKPAVLLHGAMHSFRMADDRWFEFCGVASQGHDSPHPFEVEPLIPDNPIFGVTDHWTTANAELYRVDKIWPNTVPLAEAVSEDSQDNIIVAWNHRYGSEKARIFGTTLGSENETMIAPQYLDMVARGFLWSLDKLSDENFIGKDPDESLKSITLDPPAKGLPGPGRNLVSDGLAAAMSEDGSGNHPAQFGLDGDVTTQWRAANAGPTSWDVSMENSETVGAIALIWNEDPPPVYLVEGTDDLLEWQTLAVSSDESRPTQFVVHETEGDFSHLRVSVAKTRPGQIVGLREFAAFADFSDVPAALLLEADPDRGVTEGAELVYPESSLVPDGVKLHEGFEIVAVGALPNGFKARQLVPTASGALFALIVAEDKSSARVIRVVLADDGTLEVTNFLVGLDPETTISWDGEWVYTLQQAQLTAYRDTDRNGLADERYRIGTIFKRTDKESTARVRFSDMMLGMDGRFYAVIEATEPVRVFGKEGGGLEFPENGIVSFTRGGEGLDLVISTESEILHLDNGDGKLFYQRAGGSGGAVPTDIREIVSLADASLGFSESKTGELLAVDSESAFWIKDGEDISRVGLGGEASRAAVFSSLEMVKDGGLGFTWITYRGNATGHDSIALLKTGLQPIDGESLDLQRSGSLIALLSSPSEIIRREARFEVLRRRKLPQNQLMEVLANSPNPEARIAAMAALDEAAGAVFVPILLKLARDPEPMVRAMAFRALGRQVGTRNHPVFGAIAEEQVPAVSAAILGAILRTGTDAPGIDALTLQFASSGERTLAAAARGFLIFRESADVCFAALDDETHQDLWPAAFSVLAGMNRQSVVEGIALRLEQTRSPKMRRLALKTLAEVYYRDPADRTVWEGTKIADMMLRVSLADHRVDRAFLLDQMLSRRIPVNETAELVEIAIENQPMEGAVIELLLDRETPIYAQDWLLEVARDPDRDGDLRLCALTLLGAIKSPPLLREIFPLLAERETLAALPETEVLALNRWITNPAHLANVDWMLGRAKSSDTGQGSLAWLTLLSVMDDPALEVEVGERVKKAMFETVTGAEATAMTLMDPLESSAYSGREEILNKATSSSSESVKRVALALLSAPEPQVEKADLALKRLQERDVLELVTQVGGDPVQGEAVFSRLSCGNCHNIHGEGPALAPDLASRVKDLSIEAVAAAILNPDATVVADYEAMEFVLNDDTVLCGYLENESEDSVTILDTAGNRAELGREQIFSERAVEKSIMPGNLTRDLTVGEFASLLRYVKSLSDF